MADDAGVLIYEALGKIAGVRGNRINVTFGAGSKERDKTFECIYNLSCLTINVVDCERVYKECRDFIIDSLKNINYSPRLPKLNAASTNVTTHIPYELKMLYWYMTYRAFELYGDLSQAQKAAWNKHASNSVSSIIGKNTKIKGVSNQIFLYYLQVDSQGNKGYSFSKKTFQDFAISPSRLYTVLNYNDIYLVNKYAGEKREELAVAVRYIVSIARDYDNFLDLFGGSGRATLSIPKQPGVDYYLNEWNYTNINYYNVLRDRALLVKLKKELKDIQVNLTTANGRAYFNTCTAEIKKHESIYTKGNVQTYEATGRLIKDLSRGKFVSTAKRELWEEALPSPNEINYRGLSEEEKIEWASAFIFLNSFTANGDKPMAAQSTKSNRVDRFKNFDVNNFDLVGAELNKLTRIYNTDALYGDEYLIEEFSCKMPTKYVDIEEDLRAVIDGTYTGVMYDALRIAVHELGGTSKKAPRDFRTLIYCDSPYLNTSGYAKKSSSKKGKSNRADGSISVASMLTLIERLMYFYRAGNDFIFSCRASVSKQASYFTNIDKDILKDANFDINDTLEVINVKHFSDVVDFDKRDSEGNLLPDAFDASKSYSAGLCALLYDLFDICMENNEIYKNIFCSFENWSNAFRLPLYVLAVVPDNRTTAELLRNLEKLEVFITSYEVPSLPSSLVKYKKCRFMSYTIKEFNNLLRKNMLLSDKANTWDIKGKQVK